MEKLLEGIREILSFDDDFKLVRVTKGSRDAPKCAWNTDPLTLSPIEPDTPIYTEEELQKLIKDFVEGNASNPIVNYLVVSQKGRYTDKALNSGLIKLLDDTLYPLSMEITRNEFYEHGVFSFGYLKSSEQIANRKASTDIVVVNKYYRNIVEGMCVGDHSFKNGRIKGYKDGKHQRLNLTIMVRLFPDEKYANDLLKGELEPHAAFFFSPEQLDRYNPDKPGLGQRVVNLLPGK